MRSNVTSIDESRVGEIVKKLLSQPREETFSYRTDTRNEYDLLYLAAQKGKFPDLLTITRKGLRLNKRLVHTPPFNC